MFANQSRIRVTVMSIEKKDNIPVTQRATVHMLLPAMFANHAWFTILYYDAEPCIALLHFGKFCECETPCNAQQCKDRLEFYNIG